MAKVLELQHQHQSFQWTFRNYFLYDSLVGSPCSPRDSQESSPTPQFKSINSSALSFLYCPTFTSIHDHWINHSFDSTELCQQSNVSATISLSTSIYWLMCAVPSAKHFSSLISFPPQNHSVKGSDTRKIVELEGLDIPSRSEDTDWKIQR